jgi:hypothetical protein
MLQYFTKKKVRYTNFKLLLGQGLFCEDLKGTVTDGGEGVCVDPGGMGAILEAEELGDPARQ